MRRCASDCEPAAYLKEDLVFRLTGGGAPCDLGRADRSDRSGRSVYSGSAQTERRTGESSAIADRSEPSQPQRRGIVATFAQIFGEQPGIRPAHGKGTLLDGTFTPTAAAADLSIAAHFQQGSTPVLVRFSDSTGLPDIPDTDPNALPKGIAIRFLLGEHVHTDVIAHSIDGFPTHTGEEFLEFLGAQATSDPADLAGSPLEAFLGSHPAALRFVQAPKPFPASFAQESFFGVNAFKFTNASGTGRFGRYRSPGSRDGLPRRFGSAVERRATICSPRSPSALRPNRCASRWRCNSPTTRMWSTTPPFTGRGPRDQGTGHRRADHPGHRRRRPAEARHLRPHPTAGGHRALRRPSAGASRRGLPDQRAQAPGSVIASRE